jgi:UDP-N-acetyl-D-glucosamine dehydrogenase
MDFLKANGARVAYYDPYIPVIRPSRMHAHWAGTKSVAWDQATIAEYDAVLIATAHAAINWPELAAWAKLIVDTRNAMASVPSAAGKVWQA